MIALHDLAIDTSTLLRALAAVLLLMAMVNTYFVWHGIVLYRRVRSPVLMALLGVKVAVWVAGLYIALVAFRVLFELPPMPFNGLGLGLVVLLLFLTPAFIHFQMRRFIGADDEGS